MTIIKRGFCACPRCGTERNSARTVSFSSFSRGRRLPDDKRRWSDGFGATIFFGIRDDLVYCTSCGVAFCEHEAEWREDTASEDTPRFLGRQKPVDRKIAEQPAEPQSLFERMALLSGRAATRQGIPIGHNQGEREAEREAGQAIAGLADLIGRPYDEDAPDTLKAGSFAGKAETLLRLRWWWFANREFHENPVTARDAINSGHAEPVALAEEMTENLVILSARLHPERNTLLLGEISRHLGDFDQAIAHFDAVSFAKSMFRPPVPEIWKNELSELARLRCRHVVLLPALEHTR